LDEITREARRIDMNIDKKSSGRKKKKYYTIESGSCDVEFIGTFLTYKAAFKIAQKKSAYFSRMVITENQLKHILLTGTQFICEELT
jgi:hypothetical protein